ncbi:MAG TPA: hypothetical protein VKT22_05300 [Steroidobacteraceae bacterium]|nr:hypothetical protein [Steroidobacteraceae bacterium]
MSRSSFGRRAAAPLGLLAALLTLLPVASGSAEQSGAATAPGIWQQHKMSFQFIGFTSTYSCDGLADKLRILLLAAGARKDVKSTPGVCARGFGEPDKFARADLLFYTLQPAAPTDSGSVPGIWRPVALSDRSPLELRSGDCELVDQFRAEVLKNFTTRSLVNNTSCIPHQESGSRIDVRFEVFTVAQPAKPGRPAPPAP